MNTTSLDILHKDNKNDDEKLNFYLQNYDKMCKFCMNLHVGETKMKLIYDESTEQSLARSMELIEKITYTLNNDSLLDDTEYKYINLICQDCENKFSEFSKFKTICETNSSILYYLRDKLDAFNTKSEKEEIIDRIDPINTVLEVANEEIQSEKRQSKTEGKKQTNGTICQICGKLVKGIQMHMLIHKGIKKFKCDYCQKSFTQAGQLKRHVNSHLNIRNYSCPYPECDRTFVDPSSVTKHLVIHNKDDRKFVCSLCGSTFNRLGALRYHEKTHRQERNHKCTICDKSFLAKYDLTKHFRIHTGEKPYSCDVCGKKFSISKNARVHMRVHSKEKPFCCTFCKVSFSYSSSLKQHVLKMHKNSQEEKCDVVE